MSWDNNWYCRWNHDIMGKIWFHSHHRVDVSVYLERFLILKHKRKKCWYNNESKSKLHAFPKFFQSPPAKKKNTIVLVLLPQLRFYSLSHSNGATLSFLKTRKKKSFLLSKVFQFNCQQKCSFGRVHWTSLNGEKLSVVLCLWCLIDVLFIHWGAWDRVSLGVTFKGQLACCGFVLGFL